MKKKTLSDKVIKFILSCSDEELKMLTVSSVARLFEVDRSHLARNFKSVKNFTLSKFIQKEKIRRAVSLLENSSGLTLEKISERLGFSSSEYFRKVFKDHFLVAPGIYRKYNNIQRYKNITKKSTLHNFRNQTAASSDPINL